MKLLHPRRRVSSNNNHFVVVLDEFSLRVAEKRFRVVENCQIWAKIRFKQISDLKKKSPWPATFFLPPGSEAQEDLTIYNKAASKGESKRQSSDPHKAERSDLADLRALVPSAEE